MHRLGLPACPMALRLLRPQTEIMSNCQYNPVPHSGNYEYRLSLLRLSFSVFRWGLQPAWYGGLYPCKACNEMCTSSHSWWLSTYTSYWVWREVSSASLPKPAALYLGPFERMVLWLTSWSFSLRPKIHDTLHVFLLKRHHRSSAVCSTLPLISDSGITSLIPISISARRMKEKDKHAVIELLVQWSQVGYKTFRKDFSDFPANQLQAYPWGQRCFQNSGGGYWYAWNPICGRLWRYYGQVIVLSFQQFH